MMPHKPPVFLIATVGGAPQPVVAAIKHWQPVRVVFVVSKDTHESVTKDKEFNGKPAPCILTSLKGNGITDFTGRYECFHMTDPQDYTALVGELRKLDQNVKSWRRDYGEIQLVVDFTGGTKAMSAAMALTASRWEGCVVSYVGGTERTKDGVGIVVDGQEQISHAQNPWAALGYLVEEQIRPLFNNGSYAAAKRLLEPALNAVEPPRNEELSALINLCDFFDMWNNFQHRSALKEKMPRIKKNWNNLTLGSGIKKTLDEWLKKHKPVLQKLCADDSPETREALAIDLIANARRRMEQGAFDDAVARLYRAIEALAQARLCRYGFPKTDAVSLDKLPVELQTEWQERQRDEQGCLKLGLQDNYKLLSALGDQRGEIFLTLQLNDQKRSPLVARNASILAHGYQPVSKDAAQNLLDAALKLAGIEERELLEFPKL